MNYWDNGIMGSWEYRDNEIRESMDHSGWKRPSRPSSPAFGNLEIKELQDREFLG